MLLGGLRDRSSSHDSFPLLTLLKKRTAYFSLILLSTALLLYSFAYFILDKHRLLFGITSGITRTLEGLGSGGSVTAIISLISTAFPE